MVNPEDAAEIAEAVIAAGVERGAFEVSEGGLFDLAHPLDAAAADVTDPSVQAGLSRLGRLASYWLRAEDWSNPYGPAIAMQGMRTEIPSDLTVDEMPILLELAPLIPHRLLRARVYDVLFLLGRPQERSELAKSHVDAILEGSITSNSWPIERNMWERAIQVSRRLGKPMQTRLRDLEKEFRRAIRSHSEGYTAVRASELLLQYRLGHEFALPTARRLLRIADMEPVSNDRERQYRESAADWFKIGGDKNASQAQLALVVRSLIDEGERMASAGSEQNTARASHLFELSLQKVRALPRADRAVLGVQNVPAEMARRIRELGAVQLGSMRSFTSGPIDMSSAATQAVQHVRGIEDPVETLARFTHLFPLSDYLAEKTQAEERIRDHPLGSMLSVVHYSTDGRVVYRSSGVGGTPIYGLDPATYRQMIQSWSAKVGLCVQGMIWPAYVEVSNTHLLSLSDFVAIVEGSGAIPLDRTMQFARALHYGYNGDFATASQLLAPQFENLVRFHLGNADVSTSTMDAGLEKEIGLSALMEREEVEQIFGPDVSFEIRALLCGPLGPNLRNESAHGLLSDTSAASVVSIYFWWFALRLIYSQFWNLLHDDDAASAREPRVPGEDSSETETPTPDVSPNV